MKILVLSDLHANNKVLDKLDSEFEKADAVIFAGDYAECFKPKTGLEALEKLCSKHDTIFSVLGNCDNIEFLEQLEERDVSVEKSLVFHEGLAFAGSGGGEYFTGKTEFERTAEELLSDFDIVKNSAQDGSDNSLWQNLILISHNPPRGQVVDRINDELHPGSPLFTDFIKENKPLAVICGHIHEGCGSEKIGDTLVVNPGSIGEKGTYYWLDLSKDGDGNWQVKETACSIK
ncbi:MAG: metallophosphoesterase family protein [Treponema sp.]|nr:metallophosphoesterase family protein [Treponema sp.]